MPVKTKRRKADRKKRVRAHIIADLSANHVERLALNNGYSVECFESDYGYDLNVYTYNSKGEYENGAIMIQLKATDRPKHLKNKKAISFSADKRDLSLWYNEPNPVVLVLYDAKNENAYWIYVQRHLRALKSFDLKKIGATYTLHIPKTSRMGEGSLKEMRGYKVDILKQLNGVITY